MRIRITSSFLFVLALLALAACGGGSAVEPGAQATATSANTTVASPAATLTPEPTDAPATPTTATEATAAPTVAPVATDTAVPTALCPNVPRPALVLTTGSGFELHNPPTGERCPLPLPGNAAYVQIGGERLYFARSEQEAGFTTIARLGPDGVIEPLEATRADGTIHYNARFAVAADESRLAWSHTKIQDDPNATAFLGSLWVETADGGQPVAILEDVLGGQLRILNPVRFSGDGATLFYTWEPTGLGGSWAAFNGRFDNLYRVPVTGGEPEKVFDCADTELFLCIGDFMDDGTVTYIDAERVIHVVGPDGSEMAAISTAGDYAGYPTFTPAGDLIYSEAVVPVEGVDMPLPTPGTIYRVAAPYTGAPAVVATANGLLASYMGRPFLGDDQLVVSYQEGEMWGSALLNMAGEITRLEPWPNAYLAAVWP